MTIPVIYTGNRIGAFTVAGDVTKQSYRFSIYQRVVMVAEADLGSLLGRRDFQRADGKSSSPISEPNPRGMSVLTATTEGFNKASMTPAEIAAREAISAATKSPLGGIARATPSPPPPQAKNQRQSRRRDTHGTTKVDPRSFLS